MQGTIHVGITTFLVFIWSAEEPVASLPRTQRFLFCFGSDEKLKATLSKSFLNASRLSRVPGESGLNSDKSISD